ncbi:hypothetical protein PUN28_005645 [Cardiocondyla obscurior]|uniref:Uncharacterized protein n=1 Tax=Cardiocondyla obscurior TaxID=286306 RepID=A0AAW2G6T6_9HYME
MSDLEETKRILDPSSSLPEKIRVSTDNMIERYMEDLREAPLEDLTARAFEAMNQVIKVACVSKGLKGTLIKELKTAACKTSASLAIMASKSARRPAQEVVSESFTLYITNSQIESNEEYFSNNGRVPYQLRNLRRRSQERRVALQLPQVGRQTEIKIGPGCLRQYLFLGRRHQAKARKPALLLGQPSHGLRWSEGRRGRRRPSLLP